jgi:hypothetical protein
MLQAAKELRGASAESFGAMLGAGVMTLEKGKQMRRRELNADRDERASKRQHQGDREADSQGGTMEGSADIL